MADREKVIKGLECCILRDPDDHARCSQCSYESSCVNRLKMDALSLLKAQEPRVMNADEIVLSAEPSGWLWLEMKNGHCGEAFKAGRTISGMINFGNGFESLFSSFLPKEYGKTWRCWTSRPTDEQREAIPWR